MNKFGNIEEGLSRRPNWPQGHTDTYNAHSRPIRPLPKRRLRSRLSEEVRATLFAPAPTNPTRLFQLPYGPFSDVFLGSTVPHPPLEVSTGVHTEHTDSLHDSSDDEDNSLASGNGNTGGSMAGTGSTGQAPGAENGGTQMDSYDWVENTNNKKKRKIPSPANPSAVLSNTPGAGGSSMSVGSQSAGFSPSGPHTTPRSRWKSSNTQRSPLSLSSSSHTNIRRTPRRYPVSPLETRRTGGRLFPQSGSDDTQSTTSSQNENFHFPNDSPGFLQSQFTFEHITPASTHLARQAAFPAPPTRDYPKTMSTVGTQTSPSMSAANAYPPTSAAQKKKAPRSLKQGLQKQRRPGGLYGVQPNPNGEIWICEFCEYESIFGERPEALLRQYDIKERRERRKLREKQRLLDKAKQKGKKGKSGKKAATSNTQHATGNTPPPASGGDYQSEPASVTAASSQRNRRNSQQVQTETDMSNSHHVSSGRGAGGSGGVGGGGGKTTTTTPAGGGVGGVGQSGAVA